MAVRKTGRSPFFYPKSRRHEAANASSNPAAGSAGAPLHRPRHTRNAAAATRRSATAASHKTAGVATALRHHQHGRPSARGRQGDGTARRRGGRRCGRRAGSVRLRRVPRSKTANRCPLNWVVTFKRRPERTCVGRLPGIRPSVHPHAELRTLQVRIFIRWPVYRYRWQR